MTHSNPHRTRAPERPDQIVDPPEAPPPPPSSPPFRPPQPDRRAAGELNPPADSIFYPLDRYERLVGHAKRTVQGFLDKVDEADAHQIASQVAESVLTLLQDPATDRRSMTNLIAYVGRSAKNKVLDVLRGAGNPLRYGARYQLQHEEHNASTRLTDVMLEHKELNAGVRAAVRNLPHPARAYVIARHMGDMTYKQIAARHHAPVSSVRMTMHRAYAILAPQLQHHWPLDNEAPRTAPLAAYQEAE